jgi:hypothetical protein
MTEQTELRESSDVDSPEALREFFHQVKDRAKDMSPVCFENRYPHVAAKVLWMLAQGAPVSVIAKATNVGRYSIRNMEWRHNDTLETKRKEFSKKYAIAAAEYTDLLFEKAEQLANDPEQLSKISPDKLALTVGIMTDKSSQLSGMATSVVEHRKGASIDDAAKMIADAKARIANKVREEAIEAEVVEGK